MHRKRDEFLHLYYQYVYASESHAEDYLNFVNDNEWLQSYALFKTLKIIREWQPWEKWPQAQRDPCPSDLERLLNEYKTQIYYHIFLQYLCFKQFQEVKNYARFEWCVFERRYPHPHQQRKH